MSILETGAIAIRDRKRLTEILRIVAAFGIDDILERVGLGELLGAGSRGHKKSAAAAPERLREALEKLGITFIKLGQILSTRGDLLPPEWIAELEKLQSQVPARPWEDVGQQVEDDLGGSVDEIFLSFEKEALAAGSVAQVHRARLHTGEDVVVKIRRDGLRGVVDADLRLLSYAVRLAETRWRDIERYRPGEILRHLGSALTEELDLSCEARNCQVIAANMQGLRSVSIPKVWHEFSGERLLVQGFVDGISPNDRDGLASAGFDTKLLADRGAEAFLHMALVDGFFHADPHPGNLRALPGNRIAFIDFGMIGRIGEKRRDQLLRLVSAIVDGSGERVVGLLIEWSGSANFELFRLEAATDLFVVRHSEPPLRLGKAVEDFVALARDHELALPPDLALLFKALVTADGVMRSLSADFDAVAVAAPIVRRQMVQRYDPANITSKGQALAIDMVELTKDLPGLLRVLSARLRHGRLSAEIELKGLDRIGSDLRWAATRIAVAIVTAAFAVGIAPTLIAYGPLVLGVPLALWLGLILIAAGLTWLAWPRR